MNINDIVKIKENFPNLFTKKVKEIYKVLNNSNKDKLKLNMAAKSPSRKHIILPMSLQNTHMIMVKFNKHITNINRLLKYIKSDVLADFIYANNKGMVITTHKVATKLDFKVIENYIKNINKVDMNDIINHRLLQSKSYFKILDILYFVEDNNLSITLNVIKRVLQYTYIFNNVILAFCQVWFILGVKVYKMDSEIYKLVEQPWL